MCIRDSGKEGRVYAFDIQKKALEITRSKLIAENLLDHVLMINDGHENMDKYVSGRVDVVMFNLGYPVSYTHLYRKYCRSGRTPKYDSRVPVKKIILCSYVMKIYLIQYLF